MANWYEDLKIEERIGEGVLEICMWKRNDLVTSILRKIYACVCVCIHTINETKCVRVPVCLLINCRFVTNENRIPQGLQACQKQTSVIITFYNQRRFRGFEGF